MRWLVDICQFIAALLVAPILFYRSMRTGKYRTDWDQRRGFMPKLPPKVGPRVWVHAVSMGEMNSIRGLIAAWRARVPETEFVISSTTDTGMARGREIFPDLTVIRYPLDFSRFVRRALDRIQPDLVVLVELEVWHQFVTIARERNIPVAIVNGRLTEKSVGMFRWIAPVARRMFGAVRWVGAQDEAYAGRFRQVGVPAERVAVTGSLKWDTAQIVDDIPGSDALAAAMGVDCSRPVWVCGSTGPGEEEVILNAYRQLTTPSESERASRHGPTSGSGAAGLQLVIVPRKPERFNEVAELITRAGFECIRRSASPDGAVRQPSGPAVQLVDTMGELRKAYILADVVFVGRTLAEMGGSDMMEVAALARPVIVGPHTENFADAMQQLRARDAICVLPDDLSGPRVSEQLAEVVKRLLTQRPEAQALAARGREVVAGNRGATERTLNHLLALLPPTSSH
jgi:3-deoxy-D-manno-octulosonic-acid transferase